MPAYLIEFNRRTRERRVTPYLGVEGSREAMARRIELEALREDDDIEIVALSSRSLSTLEKTHSRYFTGRDLSDLTSV